MEGNVQMKWKYCCKDMLKYLNTQNPLFALYHFDGKLKYYISTIPMKANDGIIAIEIKHCPFCGRKLK